MRRHFCLTLQSTSFAKGNIAFEISPSFKAMLHEAIFLHVALQAARKNSHITTHFATAIVALRVARKVERPSTLRNIARQVASV